ncbi:glycosyltransferase [Candidatus Pelagibacter sp. HIMB1782]|uniref:glycosyltransferase n=1 Tax=Candidatus Pelagibacter sp. HIMB1782 TaxID=3413375 RepID=UPI003F87CD21
MKFKTIIFIPNLRDGGAEKVAINLANDLAEKNREIILLTLKKKFNKNFILSNKIEFIELKSKRLVFSIFEITKILNKVKPKYFISFLYAACVISVLCKFISFSNTKIIFSIHNNYSKSFINFKSKITLILFKYFIKFSYMTITVSKGLKNQIKKEFNLSSDNIKYIYNPIFKNNIISESLKKDKYLNLFKKNNINILLIGRLTKQKNQIFVIKNLRKLKNFNKINLFIVGLGEDYDALKKEVLRNKLNYRVFFLGYRKNPYNLIRNCDYLILPSLWEGFGNVVGEGLFFKKKIISSDCNFGPKEILDDGKYGFLFKLNSSKDFICTFNKTFFNSKILPNNTYLNQFKVSEVTLKYIEVLK